VVEPLGTSSLIAGGGLTKTYDDAGNTITLDVDQPYIDAERTKLAGVEMGATAIRRPWTSRRLTSPTPTPTSSPTRSSPSSSGSRLLRMSLTSNAIQSQSRPCSERDLERADGRVSAGTLEDAAEGGVTAARAAAGVAAVTATLWRPSMGVVYTA